MTTIPLGRWLPARVLPLGAAVWAFPLVGLLVATLAGVVLLIPVPPFLAAALALGGMVLLTGALHEDACADFADAFGGRDREARLRIMRDSRIGSFGTMALVVVFSIRVTALGSVAMPLAALIGAAMTGRALMGLALLAMPPARQDGLGRAAGAVTPGGAVMGMGIALAGVVASCGAAGVAALIGAFFAGLIIAIIAMRRIGGQTGDVLGCVCLISETIFLSVMAGFSPL